MTAMAPHLTEDEIEDLVYLAHTGENEDLDSSLAALADREKVCPAEILLVAKDEGRSSTLHMASGNGHLGMLSPPLLRLKYAPPLCEAQN